ncbi:MAG: cyclase family protein [Atopobiaceae bacterium]|jgi:kynurenine formamidase|nr:cyclase family protein [Atopobiaceae bacterium]MCH4179925.1 cyclase family protein [Atopobiaceae bacterium]MCH4213676.1 cyclase family protein [Atopobiaceae bacterium]MCH4230203.1 cyclase family protein [Atopobiaceae bacterium]MCH4275967.1 cyclase family protein [Atopobiaceae bacterium]
MSLLDTFERLERYRWVELSHHLDDDSPYWGGLDEGAVEIGRTVLDFDSDVLSCLIQTFKFPGQFGTHVDFPGHFVKGGKLSDAYDQKQLVFPLVVIDISDKVSKSPDYELTLDDIHEHESRHGIIPAGSFVALRTDWYKRWPSGDALANLDETGHEHAPGWTIETLRFLFEERGVKGTGHETLDTDASVGAERTGDLVAERFVLQQGKIQIELLANLDQVPATGAVLFASVPRIDGATGLPARVWAIVDDGNEE